MAIRVSWGIWNPNFGGRGGRRGSAMAFLERAMVVSYRPPTSQTDGRTDGRTDGETDRQTTCNHNTALCTKVHRAVKSDVVIRQPCFEVIAETKFRQMKTSGSVESGTSSDLIIICITLPVESAPFFIPSSQPHSVQSPPGSPHPAHITSSQTPPSLSPSITPSTFHSRLKTHLFHKSFPQ